VAEELASCNQDLELTRQQIAELTAAADAPLIAPEPARLAPGAGPAPPSSPEAAPDGDTVPTADTAGDDLRRIEGIGPKIAELLAAAGIASYAALAASEPARLRAILDQAGSRFRLADPSSWPAQAALAARGDLEGLAELQAELKAKRRS